MTDYLLPVQWGIGDLLVSLPAVHGLLASGRRVVLIARSRPQEALARRIPGLAGIASEGSLDRSCLEPADRWLDLRDHPLQRDGWWGGRDFEQSHGGIAIDEILERIARDLGIEADFDRLTPLEARPDPSLRGVIALIPGSDASFKQWPVGHWLALAERLRARGRPLALIGERDAPAVLDLACAGLPHVPTPEIGDAVDRISPCAAAVAIDTGLFHLAVQQGIPSIGLFRAPAVFRRRAAHARCIVAPPCDPRCYERDGARGARTDPLGRPAPAAWTCAVREAERCMAQIDPDSVLEALDALEARVAG